MKETRESTELVTVNRNALPVANFADLATAGKLLAGVLPGVTNERQGFFVAATCHGQGITYMEFYRTYHMTDKGPSMRADAMLAQFRNKGGRYKIVENSTTRAAIDVTWEGQSLSFAYTMDDAKRIGDCFKGDGKTIKETWQKRPEDMMWARLVSRMVRRLCPEVNAGLYPPEEVEDFDMPVSRAAPTPITEDEAARRAKNVTAEVVAEPAVNIPDATVCPDGFGEYSGKAWETMDDETLAMAAEADGLTVGHKAAIRRVLEERKQKGGAS